MRAILFEDVGAISLGDYPEPTLAEPGDAIVRVTTSAICGSDLHLLHGRIPGMRPGSVIGHEFTGEVVAVSPEVRSFAPGDRVVGSFLIPCGACWFCERGEGNNCTEIRVLGYGMFTGDLDGAQAEYVRMPLADASLHAIDPALTDEQAIFAGDILSTAVYVAGRAGIERGDVVAITGAGPVGLFTLMAVQAYAPSQVLVVDMAEDRLKLAESLGAVAVNATKVNPVVEIQRLTGDRGADRFIECVGAPPAFRTALDATRNGGTVAVIGVYSELEFPLSLGEVWRRGITIVMGGSADIQGNWDRALALVRDGTVDPTVIISHTLPLAEGIRGYEMFEAREALKVVLKP